MKAISGFVLLALVSTFSLFAEDSRRSASVLQVAVSEIPRLLTSAVNDKVSHFVMADATAGGAEQMFKDTVSAWHGGVIGEELIASYREGNALSHPISPDEVRGIDLVPSDRFPTNDRRIDWKRVRQEYPTVEAIVRVSKPAFDRLGTYAIVRLQVITPESSPFASFYEFEKQSDGSWKPSRARVGSLWK